MREWVPSPDCPIGCLLKVLRDVLAGVLQGGVRFMHSKHGECEVLEKGEYTFEVDGRATKEAHVYFHVVNMDVPESARGDPEVWDDTPGIMHDRSAAVRARIAHRCLPWPSVCVPCDIRPRVPRSGTRPLCVRSCGKPHRTLLCASTPTCCD